MRLQFGQKKKKSDTIFVGQRVCKPFWVKGDPKYAKPLHLLFFLLPLVENISHFS